VLPVRVQAYAFGPEAPHTDLFLSPDHAVFVADGGSRGALIPIRHLLNGASISQIAAAEVHYFHLELDAHAVLFAEGLACESYLDTGNRAAFANAGPVVMAHADFTAHALAKWADAACAPLLIAGDFVTATRVALLERAALLGHEQTDDPALSILLDGKPAEFETDGCVALPGGTRVARLVSRVMVPAQIFADGGDHRGLGIAVAALELDGVVAPPGRRLRGWHAAEAGWQWTDGDATLDVTGARRLFLRYANVGRYWKCPTGGETRSAATG